MVHDATLMQRPFPQRVCAWATAISKEWKKPQMLLLLSQLLLLRRWNIQYSSHATLDEGDIPSMFAASCAMMGTQRLGTQESMTPVGVFTRFDFLVKSGEPRARTALHV